MRERVQKGTAGGSKVVGTEMIPFTKRRVDDAFGSCTHYSIPLSVLSKSCPFTRTTLQPLPHHQLVSLLAANWQRHD